MAKEHHAPHDTPFPCFQKREHWYDIKLFRKAHTQSAPYTEEMSYHTHLKSYTKCFAALGMAPKAKTHVMRRAGVVFAELRGVDRSGQAAGGRWNNKQALEMCYCPPLPRPIMRALAGFNQQGGTYFLARDRPVPEELLKQIFPEADDW